MKRIFRYLKEITTNRLIYNSSDGNLEVIGYYDYDWRRDAKDNKSKIRYVIILSNAAFSWNNKLQHVVTLSSAEAE
jgi:hypothetical protein